MSPLNKLKLQNSKNYRRIPKEIVIEKNGQKINKKQNWAFGKWYEDYVASLGFMDDIDKDFKYIDVKEKVTDPEEKWDNINKGKLNILNPN